MSRRDRDRSFEKALARHFPNAPVPSAAGPLCPDSETLAAYHENTLDPQELLSWKQHFTACSRCQELLKHLGATDHIVLQPLGTGKPAAAVSSYTVIEAPRSRLRLEWASYWRWAVPAGALAAGLLLWTAIRQTPSPNVEMAKNQQTAPLAQPSEETARAANTSPAPPKPGAPGPAASREADRRLAESSSENFGRISAADASETSSKNTPEKRDLAAPEAKAQRMVPPARTAQRQEQNAGGAHSASEPERTRDSFYRHGSERPVMKRRGVEPGVDSAADLQQEPAALSGGAPALPKSMAQSLITTPEATSAESMERKALSGRGGTVPAETLPSTRGLNSRVGFRKASAQSPAMILAPEGRVLWRVGMAGMIERSADGGRSWVAQRSGVPADLLAGSAVSDNICWIIGRAGTILRTTDGGTHWLKLPSPPAQDLAAVRATDAQQAVIFDANNQRAYKTTDGGASWTPLPAE